MRDIRILNMTQGQQIEHNEVMQRIGQLENRNLSALAKIALFDEGKALVTNGFRVEPYSGMTVKVPTGTMVQREIDTVGNHGDIVGICIQTEDQLIAIDAADGAPRTDIIEGQIISVVDKTDNVRIGNVVTGGGDTGSVVITNQVINRDVKYYLSVQKQKGTTTPTAATSASLTGSVAIAATIDLSEQYLLYMTDGEDSDWQEIDCRGAVPAATTRAEIISAINTAVGRTMAADGAGNTVELTGQGTGEISYFAFKPPITDSNADALETIFGLSTGGLYKYEYQGTNSWIKLAELDIGAADTEITAGMITDLDSKDSWTGGDDEILLKEPIMGDTLNVDTINEQTLNNGVDIEGVHLENSIINVDTINEQTTDNGVDIEGVHIENEVINVNNIYSVDGDGVNFGDVFGYNIDAPVAELQLNKGDSTSCLLHITNSTTGATINNGLSIGLDASENGIINLKENKDLYLYTNNQLRMAIDSSGNVGIGQASPSNRLHVESTTTPQFRIVYDSDSYVTHSVADGGDYTIACGEATGKIILAPGATDNLVRIEGNLQTINGYIYAYGNYLKSDRGRWPSGSINGNNITSNNIFDAMDAIIPNTNDGIIVSGAIYESTNDLLSIISKAIRHDATTIYLYCIEYNHNADTATYTTQSIIDGSGTVWESVSLAW